MILSGYEFKHFWAKIGHSEIWSLNSQCDKLLITFLDRQLSFHNCIFPICEIGSLEAGLPGQLNFLNFKITGNFDEIVKSVLLNMFIDVPRNVSKLGIVFWHQNRSFD